MKPAPVTPLVEQLAAQAQLGHPEAGYALVRPQPVSLVIVVLMACFWCFVGIGGLFFFGPIVLHGVPNNALAKQENEAARVFAGVALGCLLLGLYLLTRTRGASSSLDWYLCPAGFVMVRNGQGEVVRWDQVEDFWWDRRADNEHAGWMYRFRCSDGRKFAVYWRGIRDDYVDQGYELDAAINRAHLQGAPNP